MYGVLFWAKQTSYPQELAGRDRPSAGRFQQILINALEYLQSKQGSKGQEINYKELEMADYLQPYNSKLSIEEKIRLFALRNRMTEIPFNYGKKEEQAGTELCQAQLLKLASSWSWIELGWAELGTFPGGGGVGLVKKKWKSTFHFWQRLMWLYNMTITTH